jgi:hypothetical protein
VYETYLHECACTVFTRKNRLLKCNQINDNRVRSAKINIFALEVISLVMASGGASGETLRRRLPNNYNRKKKIVLIFLNYFQVFV